MAKPESLHARLQSLAKASGVEDQSHFELRASELSDTLRILILSVEALAARVGALEKDRT